MWAFLDFLLLLLGLLGAIVIGGVLALCMCNDKVRETEPGAEDRYG